MSVSTSSNILGLNRHSGLSVPKPSQLRVVPENQRPARKTLTVRTQRAISSHNQHYRRVAAFEIPTWLLGFLATAFVRRGHGCSRGESESWGIQACAAQS